MNQFKYDFGICRAKKALLEFKKQITNWNEFCDLLNKKCVLLAPFCGDKECEKQIKETSAAYALSSAHQCNLLYIIFFK